MDYTFSVAKYISYSQYKHKTEDKYVFERFIISVLH